MNPHVAGLATNYQVYALTSKGTLARITLTERREVVTRATKPWEGRRLQLLLSEAPMSQGLVPAHPSQDVVCRSLGSLTRAFQSA